MDLLARGRRLVLIAFAGAACAPAPGPPVGVSDYKPRAKPSASSASSMSSVPPDFRSKYAKVTARFPSVGHFVGRYDAIVWVSDDAKDAWTQQQPAASFPNGARIVMEHLKRGSDDAGPILTMERRDGAWKFTMSGVEDASLLTACAQCHAEAPRDSVFFVK